MKQMMEQPEISPGEKMAEIIRRKRAQNIPLSDREKAFVKEQDEDNRQDDNPYRH